MGNRLVTVAQRIETREVRVGGSRVRWHVTGEGPPLVLVHGLSASSRWWSTVLPPLSERYACHLLDVPRFGAALRPDETAEWIGAWVDAAGLGRVRLAGHSIGGAAVARLGALRPELVEALILISPVGMPSGRRVTGYVLPLLGALRMTTPRFVATLSVDALRAGPAAILRGGLYAARADVREQARAIRAPTLLVWGDRDPLVPFVLADEWRGALPSARLVVLHGVGHVPMVERPRELAEELREFLDQPGDLGGVRPVGGVRRSPHDDEPPGR
jgi:pimeloyl-ACP methyl ester carboxylesterase